MILAILSYKSKKYFYKLAVLFSEISDGIV